MRFHRNGSFVGSGHHQDSAIGLGWVRWRALCLRDTQRVVDDGGVDLHLSIVSLNPVADRFGLEKTAVLLFVYSTFLISTLGYSDPWSAKEMSLENF